MIILKAANESEAEALTTKDLAVQNSIFRAKNFLLDVFYKGCVE